MNNLDTLLIESDIKELDKKFKAVVEFFSKVLNEAVTDLNVPAGDLAAAFDEAAKRLDAARRGLGLVNKLPAGQERTENRRRIMGNLNRLRALVDRITKEADSAGFAAGQQIAQQNNQAQLGQRPAQAAAPHQPLPRMR